MTSNKDFSLKYFVEEESKDVINYYLQKYIDCFKKEHPPLPLREWQFISETIMVTDDSSINYDEMVQIIDQHFVTDYKGKCDYNILHFNTEGIKLHRMYESGVY